MPDDMPDIYAQYKRREPIADGLRDCYQIPKDADWYTRAAQFAGMDRESLKHKTLYELYKPYRYDNRMWRRPHEYVGPNKFNMRNADFRTVKAGEDLERGARITLREDDYGDAVAYAWQSAPTDLEPRRTTVRWEGGVGRVTVTYEALKGMDYRCYMCESAHCGSSWSQRKEAEHVCKHAIRARINKEGYR